MLNLAGLSVLILRVARSLLKLCLWASGKFKGTRDNDVHTVVTSNNTDEALTVAIRSMHHI